MNRATKSFAIVILFACLVFALVFLSLRHRKAQDSTQLASVVPSTRDERAESLSETVDLRVREYNNDGALVTLENNTSRPIWVVYQPVMLTRAPARLVYHIEQAIEARKAPRALSVELFDAWPGCHAVPSRTRLLFRAFAPPRKRGQFRVVVAYLESPETATLWDHALGSPETFDSVLERRDRELKETRTEWMDLPVGGTRKLPDATTRIAVNEPPLENPDEALLNNEIAVITMIGGSYHSGQTDYFYRDGHGTFATSEDLRRRGWVFRGVDYYMGYQLHLTVGLDRKSYAVDAVPLEYGKTGMFSFYMEQDGVIRAADNNGERASASSADVSTNDRWQSAVERNRKRPTTK